MRSEIIKCDQDGREIASTIQGQAAPDYLVVQPSNDQMLHFHGWACVRNYAEKRITEEERGAPKARTKETNQAVLDTQAESEKRQAQEANSK